MGAGPQRQAPTLRRPGRGAAHMQGLPPIPSTGVSALSHEISAPVESAAAQTSLGWQEQYIWFEQGGGKSET